MVRFAPLVFFATILVSGLASPLAKPWTVESDVDKISVAITNTNNAVILFQENSHSTSDALAIHLETQALIQTMNNAANDMTGPALSESDASKVLGKLAASGPTISSMCTTIVSLKTSFSELPSGKVVVHADLVALEASAMGFADALRHIIPDDLAGTADSIKAHTKYFLDLAIAAFA